jgi:protocatechuate 3,4-dioxygenase alpha subunit
MVNDKTKGERITVEGRVFDGAGTPLKDVLIEIWQADRWSLQFVLPKQRGTADPAFTGWGRSPTDQKTGHFRFETIKPGRVPRFDGRHAGAAHQYLDRRARHQYRPQHAHLFRDDEAEANAADPVLSTLRAPGPRSDADRERPQGRNTATTSICRDRETVFFDI